KRIRPMSWMPGSCESASSRPSASSSRRATTPNGSGWRSAISAAGSSSCVSQGADSRPYPCTVVDERVLAERLISYDTSRAEELVAAAGFVKGWLESRNIEVRHYDHNGLPVLVAEVGPAGPDVPTVVFHGHLDV